MCGAKAGKSNTKNKIEQDKIALHSRSRGTSIFCYTREHVAFKIRNYSNLRASLQKAK